MRIPAFRVRMLVPEASMNKNHSAPSGKNQIRLSWQILPVQPVTVTHSVYKPADHHLRLGIAALDTPHVFGAALRGNLIGHTF
jgi:hypothetical protein